MNGWIAINRGIFDHPVFAGHPERVGVWVWMLHRAAWRDTRQDANGRTITVKRGQLLTSYRQMSKATGAGVQVIRTLMDRLRDEHAIDTDTSTGRMLITICNYEKYQSALAGGNTVENTGATQDQHRTNTQNEQVNNITNITPLNSPKPKGKDDEVMALLLEVLPKQTAEDWVQYRRETKNPMTALAAKKMVNKLKPYTPSERIASVDEAIMRGFRGVFPENSKTAIGKSAIGKPDATSGGLSPAWRAHLARQRAEMEE